MTHGNGVSCPESLEMYEQQLKKLRPVVKYTRDTAFVPSFMEDWIFYQVAFADQWWGHADAINFNFTPKETSPLPLISLEQFLLIIYLISLGTLTY